MSSEVAVTGMGVVSAAGTGVGALRDALKAGVSAITRAEPGVAGNCFAAPAKLIFPGTLPDDLAARASRIAGRSPLPVKMFVTAALEAWVSAGRPSPERVAIVAAGSNLTGRLTQNLAAGFASHPAYLPPRFALQMFDTDAIGVLSHLLGTRGEAFTVGAASASGNAAIIAGARLVACGAAEVCLVAAPPACLSDMEFRALANLGAMAGDRMGPPFDRTHAGFVPGEGAACLVLESMPHAQRRGVTVLATIAGHAQQLSASSLADPDEDTEVEVMRQAVARAGLAPRDIGYLNAHGSGSPLGDEVEGRAIARAFGNRRPWVNSTKSIVGHCLSAAALVEAVAVIVQLREGFVHPNAGLNDPLPMPPRLVGSSAVAMTARHAVSNSFGFGGFHSSIVISGGQS